MGVALGITANPALNNIPIYSLPHIVRECQGVVSVSLWGRFLMNSLFIRTWYRQIQYEKASLNLHSFPLLFQEPFESGLNSHAAHAINMALVHFVPRIPPCPDSPPGNKNCYLKVSDFSDSGTSWQIKYNNRSRRRWKNKYKENTFK